MSIPDHLKYSKEHEWVSVEGDVATIGITSHAQDQLGDVVFVELPEIGAEFSSGDTFGSVESVKAVSDLFAPLSGEIVEVNDGLEGAPETVNTDPYGEAWMVKMKLSNADEVGELLDARQYGEHVGS